MPPTVQESADSKNSFVDLSGVDSSAFSNPYDALIEACNDEPALIQAKYATHRETRNAQQKAALLSPTFPGLILDPILQRLEDPTLEPGYVDHRNCIVFWARPAVHVRALAVEIQAKLKELAPHIWLMPPANMHTTALEITHSLPPTAIPPLLKVLSPAISSLVAHPTTHPSVLLKPLLSFDAAAVALSFVPADDRAFSYHHLRRSLFAAAKRTGIEIESRYVVPSAHITLGRFLSTEDHDDALKMGRWVEGLEEVNRWLVEKYWGKAGEGLEWKVEEELVLRTGRLWYGGGETVAGEGVVWKGVVWKGV